MSQILIFSARDKEKKLLGFSFIQLMDDKGTILKNGCHELYIYKVSCIIIAIISPFQIPYINL